MTYDFWFMDTPFVCNIGALSEIQRVRRKELTRKVKDSRLSVRELKDGYAFRFKADSEMIQEAAEFIVYERICCPFFNFELSVEQDTNRLWLALRGQTGIKDFIRSEFDLEE